jgi:hypothetical protein
MAKSGLATLRRRNTLVQEDYRSRCSRSRALFSASPASYAFQPARFCLPDGLYGPRFPAMIGMIVGCRIVVNLRAHYQQRRKKIGRSFGSPLGNDRPITWAVNGFGHQLRLILSLSPFVDSIHARNAGTTIIVPPVG